MKTILLALLIIASAGVSAQSKKLTRHEMDSLIKEGSMKIAYPPSYRHLLGKAYPAFSLKTLDGTRITEKDLIGKVTWINLWFLRCAPCMAEMDVLDTLYTQLKDQPGFNFLSVTYDSPGQARSIIKQYHLSYPVSCVSIEESTRLILGSGYPANIIIDQNGNIAYFKVGGRIDKPDVFEDLQAPFNKVKELLSSPAPQSAD